MTAQTKPIELYFFPTPNGLKISIMLEELGVPYNLNMVNILTGEQLKDDFLAISPNNKIQMRLKSPIRGSLRDRFPPDCGATGGEGGDTVDTAALSSVYFCKLETLLSDLESSSSNSI